MRRKLPGGISPFNTEQRPSIFNKLPPEEMIERRGERAIWLKQIPAPPLRAGMLPMPGQEADTKGYLHTWQKTYRISSEALSVQARSGVRFYTQFGPIAKVRNVYVHRNEQYGGNIPLKVSKFESNWFEIRPEIGLRPYHEVIADYEVNLANFCQVEFSLELAGRILDLLRIPDLIVDAQGEFKGVLVSVSTVIRHLPGGGRESVREFRHNFTSITLSDSYPVGTTFSLEFQILSTIPVAYRSISRRREKFGNLDVNTGDLEATVSPFYYFSRGDILIFTRARDTHTAHATKQDDGRFRLPTAPVASVELITAMTRDRGILDIPADSAWVEDFNYIALASLENVHSLTVVYNTMPQFRLGEKLDFSALGGGYQPSIWQLTPDESSIVLR